MFQKVSPKNLINNLIKFSSLSAVCFLLFYRLGDSMFNADQHFWYTRTQNFVNAVLTADWANTYQNAKPGVTIMWASGIGLETFMRLYETTYGFRPEIYTYDTFKYVELAVKIPLLLIILFVYFLCYKLINELFDESLGLFAMVTIFFQPLFVGVTRYFHGDGILTAFLTISALYAIYYQNRQKQKYLVYSGFFAGLAFLSKMQAVFLFAFVPFLLLLNLSNLSLRLVVKNTVIFYSVALLTVFLFFPALWVEPIQTFNKMFREARVVAEEGMNEGSTSNMVYLQFIPRILSPVVLILFPLGCFFVIKNHKKFYSPETASLIYILFYLIQVLIVKQKSERYLMPLIPFLIILAGLGVRYSLKKISQYEGATFIGIAIVEFIYVASLAPHYTAMIETAPWGALYSEAAAYLNQKPNATELKVIAIPKEHTFRPFFKGKTFSKYETLPNGWTVDYIVSAPSSDIPEKYSFCNKEHEIIFKNKVFWEIYKCK